MPGRLIFRGRSKYNARRVTVGNITFSSKGEAKRWQDLCIMQQAGEITNLRRQVKYPIEVNGIHITTYTADFVYDSCGKIVVEDFKSPATKTEAYRLRKKLLKACYGIDILETEK